MASKIVRQYLSKEEQSSYSGHPSLLSIGKPFPPPVMVLAIVMLLVMVLCMLAMVMVL